MPIKYIQIYYSITRRKKVKNELYTIHQVVMIDFV